MPPLAAVLLLNSFKKLLPEVNDNVAVMGEGLGKGSVAAVFLSKDKNDYKVALVNQSANQMSSKFPR
jgi:hypothetical protein